MVKLTLSKNTISETDNPKPVPKASIDTPSKPKSRKFSHKCINCNRSFGTKHGLALHRNKCDQTFGIKLKPKAIKKNGKTCKVSSVYELYN